MGNPIPAPPADASATRRGLVSTGTQTFAGNKTFSGSVTASNISGTHSGTNTGDVTLGAAGSSPNASGATLTGQVLNLEPASATHPGILSAIAQSIAGLKTFVSGIVLGAKLQFSSGVGAEVEGNATDGVSAVGVILDNAQALSTSGAKLVSIQNAGTEKGYFDKDGGLTISGVANNSNAITIPGSGTASARILFTDTWLDKWIGLSNGLVQINGGLYSSGSLYVASGGISTWSTATLPIVGGSADGASAVGVRISSKVAYSTAGAKLLSVRNDTTEKAYIDKDGSLTISGVASGSNAVTIPDGSRIYFGTAAGVLYRAGGAGLKTDTSFRAESGFLGSSLTAVSTNSLALSSSAADGASAVGGYFNASTPLTTAGAKLWSWRNNSTEKAYIDKDGKLGLAATDSSGTPGAVTINQPAGKCAVASGANSVVVTNSLVSTSSIVIAVLQDNTDAVQVQSVVPASGSFTVNLSGVTTGARKVGFLVIN